MKIQSKIKKIPITVAPMKACGLLAEQFSMSPPRTPRQALNFLKSVSEDIVDQDKSVSLQYTSSEEIIRSEETILSVEPQVDISGTHIQWGAINEKRLRRIPSASVYEVQNAIVFTICGTVFVLDRNGNIISPSHTKYDLLFGCYDIEINEIVRNACNGSCLLYTSPSPRDLSTSRMPSSA